jgi:hypothetical protein
MSERHVVDVDDGQVLLIVDQAGVFDVAAGNVPGHVWIVEEGDEEVPWVVYSRDNARVVILPPPRTWGAKTEEEMFHRFGDLRSARFWHHQAFETGAFREIVAHYRPDLLAVWAENEAAVAALDEPLVTE